MQLEVGKYYKTRDGRKVYVFAHDKAGDTFKVSHKDGFNLWHYGNGSVNIDARQYDLIAEWIDEPSQPTLSGHTIDHIAIDSLKHHYATEMEPLQKEAFRIVLRYYGVTL